jgi:PhzF family phenazine biosynthesis protein
LKFFLVDAFTNHAFGGNPAAVVPLEAWLPDVVMQRMAMEHNQAETAFFVRQADGFALRWFTPTLEVDFCGHATLATAKVLFDELGIDQATIKFFTQVGELRVTKNIDWLEMDFPAFIPEVVLEPPEELLLGIGTKPVKVLKNFENYYLLLESETAVREVTPNYLELAQVHPYSVCITAKGDTADFVSRYFAPSYGIPEDAVTGSIHATLTPFWAERLGKTKLGARQLSNRGGVLRCELLGNRVLICGQAMVYMRGEITQDIS